MPGRPRTERFNPHDEYELLHRVGSGSFGEVYKGVEKRSGEVVAIKLIDLEAAEDEIDDIQKEIAMISACDSDYVTRYYGSHVHSSTLWIVMEFVDGGSVLDIMSTQRLVEAEMALVLREVLHGLTYLHAEGKIHRDIKAANVLVCSDGAVKLADFGVAGQLTQTMSKRNTFVGTPFWMAPEVIAQSNYDSRADIWSLGITAIELCLGEPPLAHLHPMKVLLQIPKSPPPALEGDRWSRELRAFVALCLCKSPRARPSARELLEHPFIARAASAGSLAGLAARHQRVVAARGGIQGSAVPPGRQPPHKAQYKRVSGGRGSEPGGAGVDGGVAAAMRSGAGSRPGRGHDGARGAGGGPGGRDHGDEEAWDFGTGPRVGGGSASSTSSAAAAHASGPGGNGGVGSRTSTGSPAGPPGSSRHQCVHSGAVGREGAGAENGGAVAPSASPLRVAVGPAEGRLGGGGGGDGACNGHGPLQPGTPQGVTQPPMPCADGASSSSSLRRDGTARMYKPPTALGPGEGGAPPPVEPSARAALPGAPHFSATQPLAPLQLAGVLGGVGGGLARESPRSAAGLGTPSGGAPAPVEMPGHPFNCVPSVVAPVLAKLLGTHREREVQKGIAQLKLAFDNIEKVRPGLSADVLGQIYDLATHSNHPAVLSIVHQGPAPGGGSASGAQPQAGHAASGGGAQSPPPRQTPPRSATSR